MDSIINQSLEEKEIICIDDGSTDSSLKILRNYERCFPNIIKVFTQKNQYSGSAKNRGLEIARGEYVHFVDADDYLYDNVYPKIYEYAKRLKADYVKGKGLRFDLQTGKDYKPDKFSLNGINPEVFEKLISIEDYPDELIDSSVSLCTGIICRQFLIDNDIKFDNLRCSNDISFYYSLITKTNKIAFFNEYIYHYQVNNPESLVGIAGDNLNDLIKSYFITKQNIEHCNSHIKIKILIFRLSVILGRIYKITREQRKKFKNDIIDLLMSVDWKEIKGIPNITDENIKKFFDNDIFENAMLLLFVNGVIPTVKTLSELSVTFKRYKHIYVYGAGKNCKSSIIWLKENGIIPKKILVNSLQGNPSEIENIKVVELNSEKASIDKSEIAIFITASVYNLIPIHQTLKEAGYNNVFCSFNVP